MEEEKKSVSYPSLVSHMTSSFLNHPVFTMAEKVPVPTLQLLGEFSPLLSSLPCDIHLVNLRTIQSKVDGRHSDEAALILHRKGFDCRFPSRATGLLCSTTQGKISVQKLFSMFTVASLTPSSLSLMHSPPDARNISEINLSPMEISTFRIQLRWTRLSDLDWEAVVFYALLGLTCNKEAHYFSFWLLWGHEFCDYYFFFFFFTSTERKKGKKKKKPCSSQFSFFKFHPRTTTFSMNRCNDEGRSV